MNIDTQINEEAQSLINEIDSMLSNVESIEVIKSDAEYDFVDTQLGELKKKLKQLEAIRKEMVKPIDEAKKEVQGQFKPAQDKGAQLEKRLKGVMSQWLQEQERKRREAEAAEAERVRKQQAKLQERAQKAAEKGHEEKAEELQAQSESVSMKPSGEVSKGKGTSTREVWKCEVTDKMEALKAVIDGRLPITAIEFNQRVLDDLAKAMKEHLNIPGLKANKEVGIAKRTG